MRNLAGDVGGVGNPNFKRKTVYRADIQSTASDLV